MKLKPPPPGNRAKHPFATLKKNGFFFVPASEFPKTGSASLRTLAGWWARRKGWKLTTEMVDEPVRGIRVWRIS